MQSRRRRRLKCKCNVLSRGLARPRSSARGAVSSPRACRARAALTLLIFCLCIPPPQPKNTHMEGVYPGAGKQLVVSTSLQRRGLYAHSERRSAASSAGLLASPDHPCPTARMVHGALLVQGCWGRRRSARWSRFARYASASPRLAARSGRRSQCEGGAFPPSLAPLSPPLFHRGHLFQLRTPIVLRACAALYLYPQQPCTIALLGPVRSPRLPPRAHSASREPARSPRCTSRVRSA